MASIDLAILAPNYSRVRLGDLTVWFSYETPIAFHRTGEGHTVRVNDWGPTTGKHLNQVDGGSDAAKAERVSGRYFEALLEEATR